MSEQPRINPLQHAPAAERNTGPILKILNEQLPASGRALEIASGTGQHAVAFAHNYPGITWHPSDPESNARATIAARGQQAGLRNLEPPLDIDVTQERWPDTLERPFDAVLAINLIHIAPWAVCAGLLRGAGELLGAGGLLFLYGPYKKDGVHTATSNVRFEAWLQAQNPEFGVRDIGDVEREANKHGLRLDDAFPMPANNFSLILHKESGRDLHQPS